MNGSAPDKRLSWFGTFVLALGAAFFFGALVCCVLESRHDLVGEFAALDDYDPEVWAAAADRRENRETWLSMTGGVVSGAIFILALRSPVPRRFHIVFLSGMLLLVLTVAYIFWQRAAVLAFTAAAPESGVRGRTISGCEETPLVAMFATATAVIVMLAAIKIDRRI